MKYDVFISYSSKDQKMVEAICGYLESRRIRCFVAYRDITPGVVWAKAIVEALEESCMMLVAFSEYFNHSDQVDREIEIASEDHKPILTYRLAETEFTGAKKYYLKNINWIDAFPNPEQTFGALYNNICKILGKDPQPTTPSQPQQPTPPQPTPKPEQQPGHFPDPQSKPEHKPVSEPESEPVSQPKPNTAPIPESPTGSTSGSTPAVEPSASPDPLTPKWSYETSPKQKDVITQLINDMVYVEAGSLLLGATPNQKKAKKDEKPAHKVNMSAYYICRFTVTQELWEAIMGNIDKIKMKERNPRFPMVNISVKDCVSFVERLNTLSGLNFAIPTEAEWEFAARGGIHSHGYIYSGSDDINEVAWAFSWSGDDGDSDRHPVGEKKPNELGIYDMSGNVEEICCEPKGKYTADEVTDPINIYKVGFWEDGSYVKRGGSNLDSKDCRVSARSSITSTYTSTSIGLRLVIPNKPRKLNIG